MTFSFAFDNSYARLPERFYAKLAPTPVAAPRLVRLNVELARELGLDPARLAGPDGVEVLAGNRLPSDAEPLAMAYAGHQFGGWVPQLGDGRAILLGEVVDRAGVRRDIQLKGAGRTPFSRMGDGRAWLGPVLREYVVSEAMHALGVPTTRALAAVATGEPVVRERAWPGAILARVATSHVRVGTFEFFAARDDRDALRLLADHVIDRHYPHARDAAQPYRALLDAVVGRQAELVAQWLALGFIHGVMNTDNMSVAGETIDYGPCAFMDAYDPGAVYSSIDHGGRYAYANQPRVANWNLARLAQSLMPLLAADETVAVASAQAAVDAFAGHFEAAFVARFRAKLGLATAQEGDVELIQTLLRLMADAGVDFTLTFRRLADSSRLPGDGDGELRALFAEPTALDAWLGRWRARLAAEPATDGERQAAMRSVNPAFIPRNHLVEEAIAAAADRDDTGPFETLLEVLARPYEDQPGRERHAAPPAPHEVVHATFCGT